MEILLEIKNLWVRIQGRYVLKGINFRIKRGEKCFILGPNGAGKTTFIETLLGFIPFEKGEILFRGVPLLREKDFIGFRKRAGYVFQNPDDQLFSPTVEEELAFGPLNLGWDRKKIAQKIEEILDFFEISHLKEKSIYALSGGEKRLVSIACVLIMEPEILLMDEPSNALDEKHFELLIKFLKTTDKTVLVVSHDRDLINALKWKTFYLKDGVLKEGQ